MTDTNIKCTLEDISTKVESTSSTVKGLEGTNYFRLQSHINSLWKQGIKGDGIKIGVVDTGISQLDHPMINGKIAGGKNFADDGRGTFNITSKHHHGLAVTSLIVGEYVNSKAYGVAPEARVIIGKCLNDKGSGYNSSVADVIRYCVSQGCDIINCSLGGPHTDELERAVREATAAGICVVVASGNESKGTPTVSYPAAYDDSIAVGAIDSEFKIASFSNFNNFIDVIAPGVKVLVAYEGSQFAIMSGTSFSAPLISGTLALLKQKFKVDFNREPSEAELFGMLTRYCREIKDLSCIKQGHGFVDCAYLRTKKLK